jgi:hypothetical protein
MGDATFENFAADAFDATRFAAMIRKSETLPADGLPNFSATIADSPAPPAAPTR